MDDLSGIDTRLGDRIRGARLSQNLSLDGLAERSGVSRAMISKIERAESSPTAALLGRLCAGLGISLASLFEKEAQRGAPLSRAAEQPVWRDPATGYLRRDVAPRGTGSPIEIVDVTFPPGARVTFDRPWTSRGSDQHVWLFEGRLELTVGDTTHVLEAGDCLHMRLDRTITYHNPTDRPIRYAVVLMLEPPRA
jgi:transcriptional regulator with XRE-family HTH domain